MQTRVVAYKEENYLQHHIGGKWATISKTDLPVTMPAKPSKPLEKVEESDDWADMGEI